MKNNFDEEAEIKIQVTQMAKRLKEEREKARISQMDLSLMAGLSPNQVFYIETEKRIPNVYTILKLCSALQISPTVLFATTEPERQQAREIVINLVSKYM
ncbi:MAG: helix-turn-helix domain-containing protein [Bacteroidales bacterium]|jgi:transcriptional regulator with XRE-family HTH domain|nr:helix-turn-helix domain-containing protein [Bacteroidales bacterium]